MSPNALKALAVPIPGSLDEVKALTATLSLALDMADALRVCIETSLKQSTAQRQNILRAAFAGQLVPQDPNDEPASVLLARIRAARAERASHRKPAKTRKPRANQEAV